MPAKNPWQHDVVQLNNKGLDLIHPIEQVDAEHYSRMDDVKSLQEGTITPRPGTSLINASALSAPAQPVQEGQAARVRGLGNLTGSHVLDSPTYAFAANKLYLIVIYTETSSTPATVSSLTAGSTTWVKIDSIDFSTTGSPKSTLNMFRAMPSSPATTSVTYSTDIASPTFFSIHEFDGMDTGGSDGADAIVQSSTTANNNGAGTTITTTLSAFGNANNATFAAAHSSDGNRSFTPVSPMVEIYDSAGGGVMTITAMFFDGNDTTPATVIELDRDKAIFAVEIKAA